MGIYVHAGQEPVTRATDAWASSHHTRLLGVIHYGKTQAEAAKAHSLKKNKARVIASRQQERSTSRHVYSAQRLEEK